MGRWLTMNLISITGRSCGLQQVTDFELQVLQPVKNGTQPHNVIVRMK